MIKQVSDKMGLREGMRSIFINGQQSAIKAINPPSLKLTSRLSGTFDYIHFFANSVGHLKKKFPAFKLRLKSTGMLWVSWKKGGKAQTDLSLGKVIAIGYNNGFVESKTLSVDATWSAIKFTHPKKGKAYNNSYGKLKNSI